LGDDKYADHQQDDFLREIGLKRLFLHAAQLRFTTVNGHPVSVEAPLNDELLGVLKNLSAE
jgi:23S rRNA pseudouridine955/2504/2580 synthase